MIKRSFIHACLLAPALVTANFRSTTNTPTTFDRSVSGTQLSIAADFKVATELFCGDSVVYATVLQFCFCLLVLSLPVAAAP